MIVCSCRRISDTDYATEEELRERIMQDDWNCGQCQMIYLIGDDTGFDRVMIKGVELPVGDARKASK